MLDTYLPKLFSFRILFTLLFFNVGWAAPPSLKVLHLFSWWGMFPAAVLDKFTQETGITVINDLMESNEILDAKLSAGSTGYDLVTPSFLPFGARQIQTGLYQTLDVKLLPHFKGLDPALLRRMAKADPGNRHAIPVVWGSVGLSYNLTQIQHRLPTAPLTSWRLLFDPEIVKHFADCHVTLLEEPYDLLVPALKAWDLPLQLSPSLLKEVKERLSLIRPFISHFDSVRSSQDLLEGNVCLVMQWTGGVEHARAQRVAYDSSAIKTIIPQEGTVMWIDTLMIPHDAPHPKEAHLFMDFILRPDIMAEITNHTHYANGVPSSLPFIDAAIKSHPAIYPPAEMMEKIHLNSLEASSIMRLINRLMTNFRRGK